MVLAALLGWPVRRQPWQADWFGILTKFAVVRAQGHFESVVLTALISTDHRQSERLMRLPEMAPLLKETPSEAVSNEWKSELLRYNTCCSAHFFVGLVATSWRLRNKVLFIEHRLAQTWLQMSLRRGFPNPRGTLNLCASSIGQRF